MDIQQVAHIIRARSITNIIVNLTITTLLAMDMRTKI